MIELTTIIFSIIIGFFPQKHTVKKAKVVSKTPAFSLKCDECYVSRKVTYNVVRKDLVRMIGKYNRYWNERDIDEVTRVLIFANNHPDYRIDYKLMLSFFGHESHMYINATSYKNKNGTNDFGIGQHNSSYWYERFVYASSIEKYYNILPDRHASVTPHDPATGALATMVYLRSLRNELETSVLNPKSPIYGVKLKSRDLIMSYNMGFNGMISNYRYITDQTPYYVKIKQHIEYL